MNFANTTRRANRKVTVWRRELDHGAVVCRHLGQRGHDPRQSRTGPSLDDGEKLHAEQPLLVRPSPHRLEPAPFCKPSKLIEIVLVAMLGDDRLAGFERDELGAD